MTSTTAVAEDLRVALERQSEALAAMGRGDSAPYAALWIGGTWRLVHRHADFPPRDPRA